MQDLFLRVQFYRHIGFFTPENRKSEWIFFHENYVPGKEDVEEAKDGKEFGQILKSDFLTENLNRWFEHHLNGGWVEKYISIAEENKGVEITCPG